MSNQTPTDLINQAAAAMGGVAAQAVGQFAQQVAAQPTVQQAVHDLGQQAGTGARQGATSGLDTTAMVAIGVGSLAVLGIVGYAAYAMGRTRTGVATTGVNAWWSDAPYRMPSEASAEAYDDLMKLPRAELQAEARAWEVTPPRGYTLEQASKDDLARGIVQAMERLSAACDIDEGPAAGSINALFEPMTIDDTEIAVWQERDRLHIALKSKRDDRTLIDWWDDDAREAIEDGFLDVGGGDSILGRLRPRQGGALHRSAFAIWREGVDARAAKRAAGQLAKRKARGDD